MILRSHETSQGRSEADGIRKTRCLTSCLTHIQSFFRARNVAAASPRYTNVGKKAVVLPYIDFLVNEDGPYGSLGFLVSVKKTYQNQTPIT
ncbi:hypothetical protein U1Q18_042614 [Sarracenia purpurea var. burkii]